MAATHDFALDQGTTWTRTLICNNSDGTVVDFGTGATAKMQCRAYVGAPDVVMEATCVVTPAEGKIVATISPATSTAAVLAVLDSGKITENSTSYSGYIVYYDLELTWGSGSNSGNKTRLIQGRICINPEVTLD